MTNKEIIAGLMSLRKEARAFICPKELEAMDWEKLTFKPCADSKQIICNENGVLLSIWNEEDKCVLCLSRDQATRLAHILDHWSKTGELKDE